MLKRIFLLWSTHEKFSSSPPTNCRTRLDNVLWWHRNLIVRMKSGFVLLIEAKGDDRDNSDSKQKLELGKIWEAKAGSDSFGKIDSKLFPLYNVMKNKLQGRRDYDQW